MKRSIALLAGAAAALALLTPVLAAQPAEGIPRTLLPLPLMRAIVNEASGDLAFQNEIYLAGVNRNRKAEEYRDGYFEPRFLIERLKEYGIPDCRIIDLPTRSPKTWDAVRGELWITKPTLRKIADLKEVPAMLCQGSATMDVTAPLVYVGPGNQDRFYEGKDVKGKIILVNGSPGSGQRLGVEKYGALAVIGYSSSHPEFDPDEVGWSSIGGRGGESQGGKPAAGFMVSTRMGNDLRDQLERGSAIEVRAMAETQTVEAKDQMVEAVIPGAEFPNEELVFTAHLYEGVAKQGANDNISGCVAILETARTLRRMIDDKTIPALKRSVRFLFVPEISGTSAYIKMHPEISRRFFANINHDMVGEGLIKNQSLMELIQTPWSLPTYLNDVVRAFYEWMGTTQRNDDGKEAYLPVWSPTGSRDPFYYVIDPFSGGSDHQIFTHGGIRVPSAFMIVWPDQWYHTSGDTVDKSDSTQLKRVVVISAASAVVMAGAGPAEVERMIEEVGARGFERIGRQKARAEALVREAAAAGLDDAYREADNITAQAFLYEEDALDSIRFFMKKGETRPEALLKAQITALRGASVPAAKSLEEIYRLRCAETKTAPKRIVLTADEIRLARLVPVPTDKMKGLFDSQAFAAAKREMKDAPAYSLGRSESELRNLIDGRRNALQIRNAAAAHLAGVRLKDVENYLRVLETAGFVKIKKA
ncbi:MAG: M28 family peptidase [Acidobacteriota bacterium]|nr:M28 family peptidase [Acidobacteriota bacterium]